MKPERTKEEIIKAGGLLNAAQDWAKKGYGWTSIDYQMAAEAGFLAGARWQESQSSPVESKYEAALREIRNLIYRKDEETGGWLCDPTFTDFGAILNIIDSTLPELPPIDEK